MTLPDFVNSLSALLAVLLIDFTLAGTNVTIIAVSVETLSNRQKWIAIFSGTAFGAILRISLALVASQLFQFEALKLIGGMLLLWVCWRAFRHIRIRQDDTTITHSDTIGEAVLQIVIADIALSFDNVLAVAGASDMHPVILAIGLVISVVIIALAANLASWFFKRFYWLNWVGLFVVLLVGLKLCAQGGYDLWKTL